MHDIRRDVSQVERISEDRICDFDRLVDLRDRAATVPQRIEMRFHVRALDVAYIARSERRQLFICYGQETDTQLRLILLHSANAAVIDKQLADLLERLALGGPRVFTVTFRVFELML